MAKLTSAPTPAKFANAWTREFAAAVRDAGGRDGRLSKNEAKKIGERDDAPAMYGDNAVNYLERTGQKSVSIEKLIGKGHDYAFAVAAKVAGNGNRVSLVEAQGLPDDIRGDFLALRGKGDAPVAKLNAAQLTAALDTAALVNGRTVEYMSEGDYPVVSISADNPTGRVDGDTVMRRFASLIDAHFEDGYHDGPLTSQTFTAAESKAVLRDLATGYDGMDDDTAAGAVAFGKLESLLLANLDNVRVVKVGAADDDGSLGMDDGLYAYFAVGQTADGKLAGVMYGSVET